MTTDIVPVLVHMIEPPSDPSSTVARAASGHFEIAALQSAPPSGPEFRYYIRVLKARGRPLGLDATWRRKIGIPQFPR